MCGGWGGEGRCLVRIRDGDGWVFSQDLKVGVGGGGGVGV